MLFSFITEIIKNMLLMGSYSNIVFPDPLSKEEKKICVEKHLLGDKKAYGEFSAYAFLIYCKTLYLKLIT